MIEVIGVHSSTSGGSSMGGNTSLTDGHAWLTLHFSNGRKTSVGLWAFGDVLTSAHIFPDPIRDLHETQDVYEVMWGEEDRRHYLATANRYYGLVTEQRGRVAMALSRNTRWRMTHNCASWAAETIRDIFGVHLISGEGWGLVDTPRALGFTLRSLEAKEHTSLNSPKFIGIGADSPGSYDAPALNRPRAV